MSDYVSIRHLRLLRTNPYRQSSRCNIRRCPLSGSEDPSALIGRKLPPSFLGRGAENVDSRRDVISAPPYPDRRNLTAASFSSRRIRCPVQVRVCIPSRPASPPPGLIKLTPHASLAKSYERTTYLGFSHRSAPDEVPGTTNARLIVSQADGDSWEFSVMSGENALDR
ncbi:hypothetical protein LIA77_10030 [Sarocladium implicatum]|nr:hypothetical protein LIA77_10030 [Sarocladium implicatum]